MKPTRITRIIHRLLHFFGLNRSQIEKWEEEGLTGSQIWIGYRCKDCSRIDGIHSETEHLWREWEEEAK